MGYADLELGMDDSEGTSVELPEQVTYVAMVVCRLIDGK